MPGQRGQRWGKPKLPKVERVDTGPRRTAHIKDPANGEKVERCRSCGLSETPGNRLYPGMWGFIRFNIPLTLCARCVLAFMPDDRTIADPMTLDEVA